MKRGPVVFFWTIASLCFGLTFAQAQGVTRASDPSEIPFTADDVIKHFLAKNAATRAVCNGTDKECGKVEAVAKDAPSFNLEVGFNLNSDVLTAPARRNLDQFAHALSDARLAPYGFAIEGHTDARGSDAYNLRLSDKRARSVARYLEGHGVAEARLKPVGFGKQQPKTDDPLDGANRRVETRILD